MEILWLVQGFDSQSCHFFLPDPCLYKTEKEARIYCARHSTLTLRFGCKLVRIGKII